MPKFRDGSLEVEAIQFTGNFDEIEALTGGDAEMRSGRLLIATRRGPLWMSPTDWIVKLEDTLFEVLTHDDFAETYWPAN